MKGIKRKFTLKDIRYTCEHVETSKFYLTSNNNDKNWDFNIDKNGSNIYFDIDTVKCHNSSTKFKDIGNGNSILKVLINVESDCSFGHNILLDDKLTILSIVFGLEKWQGGTMVNCTITEWIKIDE